MNKEKVEKIGLGQPESTNIATQKPTEYPVTGLPKHLTATITMITGRFTYELRREGDRSYLQNQPTRTPEAALQELRKLLNWDPVEGVKD
jgi:hypothetical protein